MFSVDLSTSECDGYVVVALRGELDIAGAAAALAAVAARKPDMVTRSAGAGITSSRWPRPCLTASAAGGRAGAATEAHQSSLAVLSATRSRTRVLPRRAS